MAALRGKFEIEQADLASGISQSWAREKRLRDDRDDMAKSRRADNGPAERR